MASLSRAAAVAGRIDRAALLETLPAKGAASLEELIARLAVAERLISTDDHLEAHTLIAGARQDLTWLLKHGRLPGG